MIQPMVENDDNKQARGERIEIAITRSGKSQREIAERMGVRPQSISKWFKTGAIQAENLWTLAEITGADVRYLMFGEATPHHELHQLIDLLSPQQAKQVTLFVNTLLGCDDANMEFSLVFSQKSSE